MTLRVLNRIAVVLGAAALITPAAAAGAQTLDSTGVIFGRVLDSATAEPLSSAIVTVVGTTLGAQTDSRGAYRIEGVPAGRQAVLARLVGHREQTDTAEVAGGDLVELELRLAPAAVTLDAVRTEARTAEREVFDERPNLGVTLIPGQSISRVPRLAEADILRAAQLLPGVQARNDYSAGLNVRGGEADQNLILMDGFPIFNPFHFGGLFGTFIDGAVDGLELRTGGFPAQYGGRLSSVLDVTSVQETRSGLHGSSTLSLLASNVVLQSAFPQGRGSWSVAGRRTYADALFSVLGHDVVPYHFRDFQANARYSLTPSTSLVATIYDGRDVIDFDGAADLESASDSPFNFWWGNTVAGLRVTSNLGRFHVEQQASVSRFATALDLNLGGLLLDNRLVHKRAAGHLRWESGSRSHTAGYEVSHDDISYNVGSAEVNEPIFTRNQSPIAMGLFYDDVWRVNDRLMVNVGARAEQVSNSGWSAISPRGSVKWFITDNVALTGAMGRYTQWLHSLSREDIPVRLFDFWMASDRQTPVSEATHRVLGAEMWLSRSRFIRVEGYDKRYGSLVEPNLMDDPGQVGDEFIPTTGRSRGLDVLVRQLEHGRWDGWLSYSFGISRRSMDTSSYYPGQDRRHNLNLVASYRPSRRYTLSMRFGYGTGTPYTDIVGEFGPHGYNVRTGQWTASDSSRLEALGGERNARRFPDTQRLDVSLTRDHGGRFTFSPFVSLINAYNAHNVFMYVFDYKASPPTRKALSQLPFLPSVGLTVKF